MSTHLQPDEAWGTVNIAKPLETNTIVFYQDYGTKEILKFCENGDIFIKGKLAENDKEVVEGMREFLRGQSLLK